MISSSVMTSAMLLFGPLADIIRIEWMLVLTGVLMLAQTLFMARNKLLVAAGVAVSSGRTPFTK